MNGARTAARRGLATIALALATSLPPAPAAAAELPHLAKALEAQRALVAEQPGNAQAHNDLGNLLVLAGDPAAAAEAYRAALHAAPDFALAHYNLGLLDLERERFHRAREHFERALELDPVLALARYGLGDVASRRGHHARAVRHYARAFSHDPDLADPARHPDVLFNDLVGWALQRAYLDPPPGLLARRYADPGRMAGLLTGQAPAPPAPAEPPPPEQPVEPLPPPG